MHFAIFRIDVHFFKQKKNDNLFIDSNMVDILCFFNSSKNANRKKDRAVNGEVIVNDRTYQK